MGFLDNAGTSLLWSRCRELFATKSELESAVQSLEAGAPATGEPVAVSSGGTGSTTAAGARASLGAAAAIHEHSASDITEGTLPIARGGTGSTNAADAIANLKPELVDLVYPVGAVYISYVSTSPASLFGGTWTAITGRFPYFNAGTARGGANTHTLTVSQIPSHQHKLSLANYTANQGVSGVVYSNVNTKQYAYSSDMIEPVGGGNAHNNMPAYQTLYAWRRTA